MNYFASTGRKYEVCVRMFYEDSSHQDIQVPMFSNSALDDVRDIVDDFNDKLDCNPSRYKLDPAMFKFKIVSMRDRQGRNWIEDDNVYGGIYLEDSAK